MSHHRFHPDPQRFYAAYERLSDFLTALEDVALTPYRVVKGNCECHEDDAAYIYVSHDGKGAKHPARWCERCNRLYLYGGRKMHELFGHEGTYEVSIPHGLVAKANYEFPKGDIPKEAFSDPKSFGLRWITAHPNNAEPGVPLLVVDTGEEYVVVGGAGGKMNQLVMKKPSAEETAERKRIREQKQAFEKVSKEFEEGPLSAEDEESQKKAEEAIHEKLSMIKQRISEEQPQLRDKAREMVGQDFFTENFRKDLENEVRRRIEAEHPEATEEHVQEALNEATEQIDTDVDSAVDKLINQSLDREAKRMLGDADVTPEEFETKIAGKTIVKKFSDEQLHELVGMSAKIGEDTRLARLLQKALKAGDVATLQGIDMRLEVHEDDMPDLVRQQVDEYLKSKERQKDVELQTGLVMHSRSATTRQQTKGQSSGATDRYNALSHRMTGNAIMDAAQVERLGVENAARVMAAYLHEQGVDTESMATQMEQIIPAASREVAMGAIAKCDTADEYATQIKKMAKNGDGTVPSVSANAANLYLRNDQRATANVASGQLRALAASAATLKGFNPKQDMILPGSTSFVKTNGIAQELGLARGDYGVVKKGERKYELHVKGEALHTLARARTKEDAQRNQDVDGLRELVRENNEREVPFRVEGMGNVIVAPHQELAIRATLQQKKMMLNHGAGSGKTCPYYVTAAAALHEGLVDKVLMTMPGKVRAQQMDYTDPADGKTQPGEAKKFLSAELYDKVATADSRDNLVKALKQIQTGEKKILILSPEMQRNHAGLLLAAGFGGEKSMYIADEAHRLATGRTEKESQMAKVAREKLAQSEYVMFGTGTAIENDPSELWSLYDTLHPGELGSQKDFSAQWSRLARLAGEGENILARDSMTPLRERMSGGMVSHFEAPHLSEGGMDQPIVLDKQVIKVPLSEATKKLIAKSVELMERDKQGDNFEMAKAASMTHATRVQQILNQEVYNDQDTDSEKHRKIKEILDEHAATGGKAIVFADNLSCLSSVEKGRAEGSVVRIDGSKSDKQVADALMQMKTNPEVNTIALSLAGNYGLNLQEANLVVLTHPTDTYAQAQQVIARAFRRGQQNPVVKVIQLVSHHQVEMMAHYRNEHVKGAQTRLLTGMAEDASGAAQIIDKHLDTVMETAGAKGAKENA